MNPIIATVSAITTGLVLGRLETASVNAVAARRGDRDIVTWVAVGAFSLIGSLAARAIVLAIAERVDDEEMYDALLQK